MGACSIVKLVVIIILLHQLKITIYMIFYQDIYYTYRIQLHRSLKV